MGFTVKNTFLELNIDSSEDERLMEAWPTSPACSSPAKMETQYKRKNFGMFSPRDDNDIDGSQCDDVMKYSQTGDGHINNYNCLMGDLSLEPSTEQPGVLDRANSMSSDSAQGTNTSTD